MNTDDKYSSIKNAAIPESGERNQVADDLDAFYASFEDAFVNAQHDEEEDEDLRILAGLCSSASSDMDLLLDRSAGAETVIAEPEPEPEPEKKKSSSRLSGLRKRNEAPKTSDILNALTALNAADCSDEKEKSDSGIKKKSSRYSSVRKSVEKAEAVKAEVASGQEAKVSKEDAPLKKLLTEISSDEAAKPERKSAEALASKAEEAEPQRMDSVSKPEAESVDTERTPSVEAMGEDDNLKAETAEDGPAPLNLDAPILSSERAFSRVIRERGRELSHSLINIGGTPQRSGRFWLAVFVMLVVISMLVVLAHFKHREIQLGYALSEATTDREALLEENRKLRIELRVLSGRERLAKHAEKQLGLVQPRPDQILFLNRTPREHMAPASPSSKRLDGLDNVKILEN